MERQPTGCPVGGAPDRSPRPARADPVASSTALGGLPHLGTLRAETPRAGPPGDRTVRHCVLAGQSGFPCSEPPRSPGSFRLSCGADDVVLVAGENPSQAPWNGQFLSTGSSQIRPHPLPRGGRSTHTPVEKRCVRHAEALPRSGSRPRGRASCSRSKVVTLDLEQNLRPRAGAPVSRGRPRGGGPCRGRSTGRASPR